MTRKYIFTITKFCIKKQATKELSVFWMTSCLCFCVAQTTRCGSPCRLLVGECGLEHHPCEVDVDLTCLKRLLDLVRGEPAFVGEVVTDLADLLVIEQKDGVLVPLAVEPSSIHVLSLPLHLITAGEQVDSRRLLAPMVGPEVAEAALDGRGQQDVSSCRVPGLALGLKQETNPLLAHVVHDEHHGTFTVLDEEGLEPAVDLAPRGTDVEACEVEELLQRLSEEVAAFLKPPGGALAQGELGQGHGGGFTLRSKPLLPGLCVSQLSVSLVAE